MKLNRWYRRPYTDSEGVQRHSHRCPIEMGEYEDSGRPKVKYRTPNSTSGCSGRAWLQWEKKAELMPADWGPA